MITGSIFSESKKTSCGIGCGYKFPLFLRKESERIPKESHWLVLMRPRFLRHLNNQSAPCIWFEWRELWRTFHYFLPLYNDACVDEIFQFACENHADLTYVTLNKHLIIMGCTFSKKHFRRFSKKQKVSKSPLLMIFVQNMNKTCYFTSVSFLKSVSVLSTFIHCDVIKGYTPF